MTIWLFQTECDDDGWLKCYGLLFRWLAGCLTNWLAGIDDDCFMRLIYLNIIVFYKYWSICFTWVMVFLFKNISYQHRFSLLNVFVINLALQHHHDHFYFFLLMCSGDWKCIHNINICNIYLCLSLSSPKLVVAKTTTTVAPTIIAKRIDFFGLHCQTKPNCQKYTIEKPQNIYTRTHIHTHACCTRTVVKI